MSELYVDYRFIFNEKTIEHFSIYSIKSMIESDKQRHKYNDLATICIEKLKKCPWALQEHLD